MELISKESAYKAIKSVCDKFNMAFGVNKWSRGSFSAEIATCLDELPVYDPDGDKWVIKDLLDGKWVCGKDVQRALNLSYDECFALFDTSKFGRWWGAIQPDKEVVYFFRIKRR